MNIAFTSSSGGGGHGAALHLVVSDAGQCSAATGGVPEFLAPSAAAGANKRKRRPAGTPDPDAEVVALSPQTLMESDRYVCEICNQGFQRDQNLQMHRRRHKVPWKLLKRPTVVTTKRVYICPERSCLHHDPAHALGDLVGIKKHYRRKHCTEKQWKCDKCSKGYAVQSDYKAHLKTCGTRGHCCDCGRVFSRVESFIEHQDTCGAVKRKTIHSGGESERTPHHATDTRTSNGSPSQSSDTTQAMSFTHSGISDTAARSAGGNSAKALQDEHARRIQAESQAATPSSALPAWLTDSRRNELELLQRLPTDHAHSCDQIVTQAEVTGQARVDRQSSTYGSRSQVTYCSSNSGAYPGSEVISCPEMKMILEPSLQLSLGQASAEVAFSSRYKDIKPSFSNSTVLEKKTSALNNYHDPKQITRVEKSSRPTTVELDALAHLVPPSVGQSGCNGRMKGAWTDQTVLLSGFLTALSPVESSARLVQDQSTKLKHENKNRTEKVSFNNPTCTGSALSYHENRAGNVHESDPAQGVRATRGLPNAQLEPATSSVITSREALHNLDVAEADHLFGTKSVSNELVFKSQKEMAATHCATTVDDGCDQKRADLNAAWSDLTRVRRITTDEARQEYDEAHRELARAEILKREAREQLQFATAEKADAERAREAAKREVEISEAELVEAKRLRAHAQAELQKAGSQGFPTSFCVSCKSAIESRTPPRRSTSTSPTSWSMMAPSPSTDHLEPGTRRSSGAGQIFTSNSGDWMSWSEPISGFDNSGRLWPAHGSSRMSCGIAVGKSPASGGNPGLADTHVSNPEQFHWRVQTAPQVHLDLN